jgi:predicted Zn finger-like uncharacterized protein
MNVACPQCRTVFRIDPAKVAGAAVRARCSVCSGIIPVSASVAWGEDFPDQLIAKPVSSRGLTAAAAAPAPPSVTMPTPRSAPAARQEAKARPSQPRDEPFQALRAEAPARATPSFDTPTFPAATLRPPTPVFTPPVSSSSPTPSAVATSTTTPARDVTPRRSTPFSTPGQGAAAHPAVQPARRVPNPFLSNDPNQKARRLARALVSDMVAYNPQKREEGVRNGTLKPLFRDEIKKSYEEYVEQVGREFADATSHFQDALNEILAQGKRVF